MPTKEEIKEFSAMIIRFAFDKRLGYMDAICEYCRVSGLEIEMAAKLISNPLKAKIREEAEAVNMMKKRGRLPI
jgi:hypothetical protein